MYCSLTCLYLGFQILQFGRSAESQPNLTLFPFLFQDPAKELSCVCLCLNRAMQLMTSHQL